MQSLFPQHNSHNTGEKPLLEFKAGKCVMEAQEGGDFMVSADDKRGKIAIVKGEGYVYFRWIDRSSGQMDENCNWIVFPNSVVFKKIDTGRSQDRVYLLKWKDEARRLLFWLQDTNKDKDEENCKQVNELFNNPSAVAAAVAANAAAAQASAGAGVGGGAGGPNGAEEWMRMLGLAPPARAAAPSPAPPASTGAGGANTQALDLARILAGLSGNPNNIGSPSTSATPASSASAPAPATLSAADLARAFSSTATVQEGESKESEPEAAVEEKEDNTADDSKMESDDA